MHPILMSPIAQTRLGSTWLNHCVRGLKPHSLIVQKTAVNNVSVKRQSPRRVSALTFLNRELSRGTRRACARALI